MWGKKQNVEQYYVEQYTIARRGFLINNRHGSYRNPKINFNDFSMTLP